MIAYYSIVSKYCEHFLYIPLKSFLYFVIFSLFFLFNPTYITHFLHFSLHIFLLFSVSLCIFYNFPLFSARLDGTAEETALLRRRNNRGFTFLWEQVIILVKRAADAAPQAKTHRNRSFPVLSLKDGDYVYRKF